MIPVEVKRDSVDLMSFSCWIDAGFIKAVLQCPCWIHICCYFIWFVGCNFLFGFIFYCHTLLDAVFMSAGGTLGSLSWHLKCIRPKKH